MVQVLNQWINKTCATFSVMGVLLKYWIGFDLERLSLIKVPYYHQVEKLFKEEWLIKQFVKIPTPKLVDLWLRKWEWLITSTSRWDFTLNDNKELNVVEFDENSQHFFIIVEDYGDRWKCLNSWGKEWGEGWFFYINKSDFKYLFTPRRVIIK